MKHKRSIIIAGVSVTLVGVAFIFAPIARDRARRTRCMSNLSCLGKTLMMYAMDHDEAYPTNAGCMADYADNVRIYICPGSGTRPPASLSVEGYTNWVDYILIPWSNGVATPGEYPLMYDRRLSHHQGKGINVLWVDGRVVWDKNAKGLKRFAEEHPQLEIPMPEDLE